MSFVQETLEERLSSCQNVWFFYCTEINIVIYVLYTKQRICGRWAVPGVGNCLFLPARGWGIDRQVRTKLQIPGGMPRGGGVVTGRIEPCINLWYFGGLIDHTETCIARSNSNSVIQLGQLQTGLINGLIIILYKTMDKEYYCPCSRNGRLYK